MAREHGLRPYNPNFDFKRETLQYPTLGRRQVIKWMAVLLAGGGAALYGIDRIFGGNTGEQERAGELLKDPDTRAISLARNLKVGVPNANLRDKPVITANQEPSGNGGIMRGHLELGTQIAEALVVWGNDPDFAMDRSRKKRWLAFVKPGTEKEIVFSYSDNFIDPEGSIVRAKPVDLKGPR
ncbi:MAG: hypothetical protein WD988_00810 [Candidatus Curtissbacteria bacterium]